MASVKSSRDRRVVAAATSGRAETVRAIRQAVAADGTSHPTGAKSLLRACGLVAASAPTTVAVLVSGLWWTWPAHLVVATTVLATIPSVFHEGTHGSLARNRGLNDACATVAAALHLVPFATWRYFHLAHHANTGTDRDPEDYPMRWSKWSLIAFPLFQFYFTATLWVWAVDTALGRGPRWIRNDRQRHTVRSNVIATAVLILLVAAACVLEPRLLGLLVAPSLLGVLLASFTIVPEHFPAHRVGPGEPDQLDRTSSFMTNALTRFVMWNSNFHAAHHFAPKVPAHYLPTLDRMVSQVQDPDWRWRGYLHWYGSQFRRLPWHPPAEPGKAPRVETVGAAEGTPHGTHDPDRH